ncbi:nucleotide sugar dehydrogenase [Rhizobium sp. Root1220]|uniref:nucleotide sugar dehydrogenase n=1 Tax=Rhizobium sp. Root1220 TaxID=1736432 RepID=UPI0006FFE921|nr:nucleotide sugar dehydrogenase [Rhizobium sp. Root1220]KQV70455.1 nucleotide sugar dehydrogenase [Rhizobium sp. Root1220]
MSRISILGIGYVGAVSGACLAEDGHTVVAVDIDPLKVAKLAVGEPPIVEAGLAALLARNVERGRLSATTDVHAAVADTDVTFICVGTPSTAEGSVGLDYVKQACRDVAVALRGKTSFHSVVVRSTIVPGTMEGVCIPILERVSGLAAGKDFGVGYYPEFLREGTAIDDSYNPGLIVFAALDLITENVLRDLNHGLPCKCSVVPLASAEMIKYTSNSWRAIKISFANEIGNIAKSCGIDGQLVMKVLCSDHKVSMSPYFMRPGFAFGGSCLPKDVRALRHIAHERGVPTPLLNSALEANTRQIERAEKLVHSSGGRSVGMVGISFKAGTDDLRESPLAELASRLISKGFGLKVYDPSVRFAYQSDMGGSGRGNGKVPDLRERLVAGIEELIEEADILLVGNRYEETVEPLARAATAKSLVDLTRILPDLRSGGLYEGICW